MSVLLSNFVRLLQICLLLLTMISVNGFTIGSSIEKLTKCSKYDFEEKLLEKVVRLEHSIELERKLKKFEDMMSEKLIKMANENTEKMKAIETNVNAILKRLQEEDLGRRDSFRSLKHEIAEESSRQENEFVEVIQNITVKAENISSSIIDKHNNLFNAFERNMVTQNRKFNESVADMNTSFTSFLATTKHKAENQQKTLASVMYDVNLNSSLTNEKLLDQQKKNNRQLLAFIETESSKNKVSLTACAQHKTYSGEESVLFPNIYTRNNISNQLISSLKDSGTFTCEKSGLYLISLFMSTNTHSSVIDLYKNSTIIARLYYSLNGFHQTNSATVLEHLTIGDTLTVQTSATMQIWSDRQSCASILQLTN